MAEETSASSTRTVETEETINPTSMSQLLELLQHITLNTKHTENIGNQNLIISTKLNDHNYTLWSRLMSLAIRDRGRLNHIIAPPPPQIASGYQQWVQNDSI